MRKHHTVVFLVSTACLASLAAACDSPTRPSPGNLSRIELTGPATIAPGQSVRYTLSVLRPTGRSHDVSADAVWVSPGNGLMTMDKGLVTGLTVGEGPISAIYQGRSSAMNVVVSPTGTFRLKGIVTEANTNDRVAGARVQVHTPSGDVIESVSKQDGAFAIYGVPPEAELQVSHGEFSLHTQRLGLTEHGSISISLTRSAPRRTVAGTYTLRIGSPTCALLKQGLPLLPEHLRERTYTAVITEDGNSLGVTLSGASFGSKIAGVANRFGGSLDGSRVKFQLWGPEQWYYYYYAGQGPDIVEQLDDGTYLSPSGTATLSRSNSSLEGTLAGSIRNRTMVVEGNQIAGCAGTMPMLFTRIGDASDR